MLSRTALYRQTSRQTYDMTRHERYRASVTISTYVYTIYGGCGPEVNNASRHTSTDSIPDMISSLHFNLVYMLSISVAVEWQILVALVICLHN